MGSGNSKKKKKQQSQDLKSQKTDNSKAGVNTIHLTLTLITRRKRFITILNQLRAKPELL
jgi:hypothetical protein